MSFAKTTTSFIALSRLWSGGSVIPKVLSGPETSVTWTTKRASPWGRHVGILMRWELSGETFVSFNVFNVFENSFESVEKSETPNSYQQRLERKLITNRFWYFVRVRYHGDIDVLRFTHTHTVWPTAKIA